MPFEIGRAKTGGKQVGTPNKATREIKEIAQTILEDPEYQEELKRRIINGEAVPMEILMHHYEYCKPKPVEDEQCRVVVNKPAPRSPQMIDAPTSALPLPEDT